MCRDLFRSKDERCILMHERHEGVCETSEVLNENPDYADGAKEGSYFGEVFAGAPVNNFVHSGRVRDMAFHSANVPYNSNLSQ